jgi:hypothetical protein
MEATADFASAASASGAMLNIAFMVEWLVAWNSC